ncbi:MAG: FAD-linked oxidase C-terminal domain-containing protein [Acidobacteriota bacterium]
MSFPSALAESLRGLLGARFSTVEAVRDHHSRGESYHAGYAPDAVAFPASTDEVSAIVGLCAQHQTPIVPFGAGTSLEGHISATSGGLTVDLQQMNQVLRVSADDLDATVQAGVTHRQLNKALQNTGLMFTVDPGADATLGGMAATRASGTTAVRYGTMREAVLGLTLVLADGRVIHTGGRARKSAAGYDLTRLFVGSEGTLGITTELTLRLYGRPEAVSSASCAFATLEGAVRTVITTIQLGIPVARCELMDDVHLEAVRRYSKIDCAVAPTLFFDFHGASEANVKEQADAVREIAEDNGGAGFQWAATPEARARLWQARHDAHYAALALRPGARSWPTDVCVPISALVENILEAKRDAEHAPFPAALVGHVGDGNFHMVYVIDPESPSEMAEVTRLNERLIARALAAGGTCSGEHGVGLGKMKYLDAEHGAALDVMRAIKQALDPDNIMNPGKMLPAR